MSYLQNIIKKCYELEESLNDAYEFCERCGDFSFEYCSIHGGLLVVPDNKALKCFKIPARLESVGVPRAMLSTPKVFLYIDSSSIPGAGEGVFALRTLPRGVRFGPYKGQRVQKATTDYCWQVRNASGEPSHLVDASDEAGSNWMRYVNCARHCAEQNLVAYQYRGDIYYRTSKTIRLGTEMLVFYGSECAVKLNIHLGRYNRNAQLHKTIEKPESEGTPNSVVDSQNSAELQRVNAYVTGVINLHKYFNREPFQHSEGDLEFLSILDGVDDINTRHTREKSEDISQENFDVIVSKINDSENTGLSAESTKDKENDSTLPLNNYSTQALTKIDAKDRYDSKSTWECSECNRVYPSKEKLRGHRRYHKGPLTFSCSECSYTSSVIINFRKHERAVHQKYVTKHRTETHDNTYNLLLNSVEKIKTNNPSKNCEVEAVKNFEYSNGTPLKCSKCNFSCNNPKVIKVHESLHNSKNVVRCELCGYLFTTQRHLRAHVVRVHATTQVQCAVCARAFNCEEYLRRHMKRMH